MIEIQNLSFAYNSRETIIHDVSLHVKKGSIYGFLGPNGSGKTTIIRLILNLLKHKTGTIRIDGNEVDRNSSAIFSRIGSMIESPSLYNHLSGLENMKIFALYYNVPATRITEVLETVGLTDAANKTVKRYSLGMKQRLGIAICLLHDPDLLILDEPLNGLDPQGIAEMRNLFFKLSHEDGKTIFISSHLLSEIESTCDHIGIISKGKLLFNGQIAELKNNQGGNLNYKLETDDLEKAKVQLSALPAVSFRQEGNQIMIEFSDRKDVPVAVRGLTEGGIDIYNFQRIENNLEDLFLELTK